ncbi:helix-turn-helix domain-containing protein [Engelhardtia mirabilis]|uniref:Helix-turn-helix domain protein n=1 Tax=Engelhardtia mirabilis TaxID=2528011 RepID=A0A518BHW8_9BACT|nr:Helix-turn-helix domain protein [Planctomycetes bacterium Pla133]QDV00859.1 Helix-turn-helix domain protein [Planctomycetes bacterium Pla86]
MSGSNDPDILNIEQAAALLGVSVKTFNKVLHSQDLPARKIGREWKFSRSHLIDWVGAGRSSEFYKDSQADNADMVSPQPPTSSNGTSQAESPAGRRSSEPSEERRTSGWRLSLD